MYEFFFAGAIIQEFLLRINMVIDNTIGFFAIVIVIYKEMFLLLLSFYYKDDNDDQNYKDNDS